MEGLASNVKKKGKLPARHGHLEESISRHKQHIVRLEQMLRLLDNEVSHPPRLKRHLWQRAPACPGSATMILRVIPRMILRVIAC